MKRRFLTSLDYPLYEKMLVRAPKAARLWLIGDLLFQVGFLLIIMFLPILFYYLYEDGWVLGAKIGAGGIIFSFSVICIGIFLKRESYKLAIKAGIDVTKI
ncbi:MAG: hypothetical protein N2317_02410 [Syntrophales bacterium]|nr:hypothetical protein [Syntrophales bacterium]